MSYLAAREMDQEMKRSRKADRCPPAEPDVWEINLESLKAGAFGDPEDPETLLRYWKAQEAAGYPYASENVQYFEELVQKSKEQMENDPEWYKSMRPCSACKHCAVPVHDMPCRVCIRQKHRLWEEAKQ